MIEYVEAAWERGAPAFHIIHFFAELDLGVPSVSVSVHRH